MEAARATLGDLIDETPVHRWQAEALSDTSRGRRARSSSSWNCSSAPAPSRRGARCSGRSPLITRRERAGVTAVSAGNHAIAVAFAAHSVGTTAKVVMMEGADPFRVAQVRRYGAELVLVLDVHTAFETVRAIEAEEGRTLIHPFEGRTITLGTATCRPGARAPGAGAGCGDRPHRRGRALRRRLLRHQDRAAGTAGSTAWSRKAPTPCTAASRPVSPSPSSA